jgi:cardiolipin synthase A/B
MRWALLLPGLLLAGCNAPPSVAFHDGKARPADPAAQPASARAEAAAPFTDGNRVTLLDDGNQTLIAMFRAMAEARHFINLEYYIFNDVTVGQRPVASTGHGSTLGDVLLDRLAHGVQVNIIFDALGSSDTNSAFLDRLRKAGARVIAFHAGLTTKAGALVSPNDRDHRKILVIDGRIGFVGGVNLDPVYEIHLASYDASPSNSVWRDIDAEIEGPAVAQLQRLFLHTWRKESGAELAGRDWFPPEPPAGDQAVRIIGSAPGEDAPLEYLTLLTAIRNAKRSIDLSTGYFVPTHEEREELVRAARRGVRVRLLLPGKSDSTEALAAGRAAYDDLLEAGVEIDEMRGDVLHAKILVVDGDWTSVGSSNLDRRSVAFNNEVDAIVRGTATAQAMTELLDRDRARATPITLAEWRQRPLEMHEFMARFWQFLL